MLALMSLQHPLCNPLKIRWPNYLESAHPITLHKSRIANVLKTLACVCRSTQFAWRAARKRLSQLSLWRMILHWWRWRIAYYPDNIASWDPCTTNFPRAPFQIIAGCILILYRDAQNITLNHGQGFIIKLSDRECSVKTTRGTSFNSTGIQDNQER